MQGFDSPQQTQLSGPKSPEWHQTDVENKENALPEQSSASKQLVHQAVPGTALFIASLLVMHRRMTAYLSFAMMLLCL